jgi:hypothetical protein
LKKPPKHRSRSSAHRPLSSAHREPSRRLPRASWASGTALWNSIQSEFRISDAGGVELLLQACEASDRLAGLRARIEADGEVITTRGGPKAHPALREELAGRAFIVRTLVRLGVTDQPLKPVGRC